MRGSCKTPDGNGPRGRGPSRSAWGAAPVGAAAVALALVVFLGLSAPAWSEPLPGAEDLLRTGKAALQDELYSVAERQFSRYLEERGAALSGGETEEILGLLLQALHEQGKDDAILKLLAPQEPWARKLGADNATLVFWRAMALHGVGRPEEALSVLGGPIVSGGPYAERADRLRAWCLVRMARTNEAIEAFARFDSQHGGSVEAPDNLLEWGKALFGAGRLAEARKVLERLAGMPGGRPSVQLGQYCLGRVLMAQGAWPEAVAWLSQVAKNGGVSSDVRAEAWLSSAEAHAAQTNWSAAANAASNGIAQAHSPDVKRRGGLALGSILLEAGRLDEAVTLLKRTIAEKPSDPLAGTMQLKMSQALFGRRRYEAAVGAFQQYLETFTNVAGRAEAYEGRAWALYRSGHFAESAGDFEKAYANHVARPKKEQCLFKVADAYFANGQYKLAGETYARVLKEFPDSSLRAQALFQEAQSLARSGDAAGAKGLFTDLAEAYPTTPMAAEALIELVHLKEAQGHWLEALDGYNGIMKVYTNGPFLGKALYGRGVASYRVYRFGAALDDFKKVIEEFPDADLAEDASYMIGLCYYARRKDTLALSSFLSFITRYPESKLKPEAIFWVGEFQYNRGQYEMAEQAFLLLADSYPAHRLGAEALFRAGRAAAGRKNYVRSIEILGRMIKKYPQSPRVAEARFSQADALSELGRFSEAILVFDEIINQHAGTDLVWPAWGRKGDCQFMLGQEDPKRYEESLASYRVVASQSASSRDLVLQAEYKIGRCYAKLGHMDEALEQYYTKVINRYFEETAKGVWHNEASKVWFTRAARDAADILEARKDWRGAVSLLGKIVDAGMPASEEAKERSERIRTERGWLFH